MNTREDLLKFKIKSIINEMPPSRAQLIKFEIMERTGLKLPNLNKILNARKVDSIKLPFEHGVAIAEILNKEPKELLN